MTDTRDPSGGELHLSSLEAFRNWLSSLIEAQQPLEEWSLSLEELARRWPAVTRDPSIPPAREPSRLFF